MADVKIVETVPAFTKRIGDYVVEGANNTILILGTDRARQGPAAISDGNGTVLGPSRGIGTGTIHLIAGRNSKDPDFILDSAFLYLSKRTSTDKNLNIGTVAKENTNESPAAILKSDAVRIIGRKNIKICGNNDEKHFLFIDGKKILIEFEDNVSAQFSKNKITFNVGEVSVVLEEKKATVSMGNSTEHTKIIADQKTVHVSSPHVTINSKDTNIKGNVRIEGALDVTGDVHILSTTDGISTNQAALKVEGRTTVFGRFQAFGDSKILPGKLHVGGDTLLEANLHVVGNSQLDGTLDVTGRVDTVTHVVVGGRLSSVGQITTPSSITATLDVSGAGKSLSTHTHPYTDADTAAGGSGGSFNTGAPN